MRPFLVAKYLYLLYDNVNITKRRVMFGGSQIDPDRKAWIIAGIAILAIIIILAVIIYIYFKNTFA